MTCHQTTSDAKVDMAVPDSQITGAGTIWPSQGGGSCDDCLKYEDDSTHFCTVYTGRVLCVALGRTHEKRQTVLRRMKKGLMEGSSSAFFPFLCTLWTNTAQVGACVCVCVCVCFLLFPHWFSIVTAGMAGMIKPSQSLQQPSN